MVQVKAPLAQASVAVLAQLSVEMIGEVMKHDHQVAHPQPTKIPRRKVAEHYNQNRPYRSQQRQVISFQPTRDARQHKLRQPAFEWHQQTRIGLPRPGKFLLAVNASRPLLEVRLA